MSVRVDPWDLDELQVASAQGSLIKSVTILYLAKSHISQYCYALASHFKIYLVYPPLIFILPFLSLCVLLINLLLPSLLPSLFSQHSKPLSELEEYPYNGSYHLLFLVLQRLIVFFCTV